MKCSNNYLLFYTDTLINLASFGIHLPTTTSAVVCLKELEIFTKKLFKQLLPYEILHR